MRETLERSAPMRSPNVPSDARIASLAAKRYRHITYQQLIALGLTRRQIALRIKKGQLIPVHRGVYAVGHPRPEGIARAAAAVLACGPDAVLSHFSAAALWGLTGWPTIHEVTVPAKRRPSGVRIPTSTPPSTRRTSGACETSD